MGFMTYICSPLYGFQLAKVQYVYHIDIASSAPRKSHGTNPNPLSFQPALMVLAPLWQGVF